MAGGYRVQAERDADRAIERARFAAPGLLLISTAREHDPRIQLAHYIREPGGLDQHLPVVILCDADLESSEGLCVGDNVYLTRPDNFD